MQLRLVHSIRQTAVSHRINTRTYCSIGFRTLISISLCESWNGLQEQIITFILVNDQRDAHILFYVYVLITNKFTSLLHI